VNQTPGVRELSPAERRAVSAVVAGTGAIGLLGFANSFARVNAAASGSFGWWSWTVPLGIDLGIAVFSALDIVLARMDMRIRWLRLIPWTLTAVTVFLNVAPEFAPGRPVDAFSVVAHAALPALWVLAVEVGAHVLRMRAGLVAGTRMDRVRRSRWLLSPVSTAALWRRMVLWEIRSYPRALERERARLLALADLQERYGKRWKRYATPRERVLYRLGELTPVNAGTAPVRVLEAGVPAERYGEQGSGRYAPVPRDRTDEVSTVTAAQPGPDLPGTPEKEEAQARTGTRTEPHTGTPAGPCTAPAERRTGTPAPTRTGTGTEAPAGGRTGTATKTAQARTDAELIEALAVVERDTDGTVPVRRAARALGCGPDRARRLLRDAGLLREDTTGPLRPSAATLRAVPMTGEAANPIPLRQA